VVLTVMAMFFAFLQLRQTQVATQIAEATADWSFRMQTDPTRHRLVIKGDVGPGFGRQVEDQLAEMKDPVEIEIASGGGLLNEALRAARAIEARPNATVVVRGWCASACLIVLMSGKNRLAAPHAHLDFHAGSAVAKTDSRFRKWAVGQEIKEGDDYLQKRGVPLAVIQRKNQIGPTKLDRVSVPYALESGILTGLIDAPPPPATKSSNPVERSGHDGVE
jgi:hypothetical protein